MWFKNLYVVQLADAFELSAEMLEEKLQAYLAKPCGVLQLSSYGWTAPLGRESTLLVHAIGNFYMLAARKETKLLPASIIREALNSKVAEIEQTESRKLGKKEKAMLQEEIRTEMLSRAFHKTSTTYAYIDTKQNLLIIDSANPTKAEEFTELLRKSVGKLDIVTLQTTKVPRVEMSQWLLTKQAPANFTVEDYCQMIDKQDITTSVKCVNHDLMSDEIAQHLRANKQVVELALTWNHQTSLVLCHNFIIKRFQFLDMIKAEIQETQAETAAERFDADFAIMTAAISELLPAVFGLFGGLVKGQVVEAAEYINA